MTQYQAVFELSSLDGNNGFQIEGESIDDFVGGSVSSAGDINSDGFDDFLVGAFGINPNGTLSGGAYLVFGTASPFGATFALSGLTGSNGFQINGEAAYDRAGVAVASAGDVNGDGFDDMIVSAARADPNGANSGATYVVYGRGTAFAATVELSMLIGSNGFQISGEVADDYSGLSVSAAGDVNNDGFDDLIVGAPYSDANGNRSGAAYVVFGKSASFGSNLNLSTLDGNNGFQISGEDEGDYAGTSVASGDFNSDGFDDLLIGAEHAEISDGAAYVVFGKASGFTATLEVTSLDGNNGFTLLGEGFNITFGRSVGLAGDLNADGIDDMIVGAPGAPPYPGAFEGACYVVFGRTTGFGAELDVSTLDGTGGFRIDGVGASDTLGRSVKSAGDVNGDGFDDLIVGVKYADPNGNASGATYVLFGKASSFGASFDLTSLDGNNGYRIDGEGATDYSGVSASSAGDINGDGFDDLIVGADGLGPNDTGGAYVVFGSMPGVGVERTGTDINNTIHGGDGDDELRGLSGDDTLLAHGGDDQVSGGDGQDTIDTGDGDDVAKGGSAGDALSGGLGMDDLRGGSGADTINGGGGSDELKGGSDGDSLFGDDGNDTLEGGDGFDSLTGGAGDDRLIGGDSQDVLTGGSGVDRFVFNTSANSTSVNYDIIKTSDFAADKWDVDGNITAIDATVASGQLATNNFDTKLAAAIGAAQLGANHAVLFTPTTGNLQGKTFLIVDQNGLAGYQANVDLVMELRGTTNLGSIGAGDFI